MFVTKYVRDKVTCDTDVGGLACILGLTTFNF